MTTKDPGDCLCSKVGDTCTTTLDRFIEQVKGEYPDDTFSWSGANVDVRQEVARILRRYPVPFLYGAFSLTLQRWVAELLVAAEAYGQDNGVTFTTSLRDLLEHQPLELLETAWRLGGMESYTIFIREARMRCYARLVHDRGSHG